MGVKKKMSLVSIGDQTSKLSSPKQVAMHNTLSRFLHKFVGHENYIRCKQFIAFLLLTWPRQCGEANRQRKAEYIQWILRGSVKGRIDQTQR